MELKKQCKKLGSGLVNKVLDGIKKMSNYTSITPITPSDLKGAFQKLRGKKIGLKNLRLILTLLLSLMGFFRYGTAQTMKFSIKDFFSKCDQIRSQLWIWSHLLKNVQCSEASNLKRSDIVVIYMKRTCR